MNDSEPTSRSIALAGNPNSGKSAFFNLLTGANQKVANFPGVTVEKKEGYLKQNNNSRIKVVDLPGTYSLDAESPDEKIAQEILLGFRQDTPQPELIVVVVDSTHLQRSLFLISQLMEFGLKVVICMNMYDLAEKKGLQIDLTLLSRILNVPVIPTVAIEGRGREELIKVLAHTDNLITASRPYTLPKELEDIRGQIAADIKASMIVPRRQVDFWAGKILSGRLQQLSGHNAKRLQPIADKWQKTIHEKYTSDEISRLEIEERYSWIEETCRKIITNSGEERSLSDKVDRVLLHGFFGPAIFIGIMTLIFQAVFSWATPFMDVIDSLIGLTSETVTNLMPASALRDLVVEGIIGGVGNVIIFLPQIMILFFFIGLLEASGYLARAAFLVDRLMVRSGLTGKSFIPLLSSFACAVPGIMAARTIKNDRDRLTTIMVAPLITCSARLPVYTLLIGAFVPVSTFAGIGVQGLTLFSLYIIGIVGAVVAAKVFRKTIIKGQRSSMVLELPDYKVPQLGNLMLYLWNRTKIFLRRAGKIILVMTIVLWAMASFPKNQALRSQLETTGASEASINEEITKRSFAGQFGQLLEPIVAPLGYDWKVAVGLVASFAAREVFVSTMGTLYNIQDADETSSSLKEALLTDRHPETGKAIFNLPMVAGLLIFFAFAMQCMSTVAVMKRETNSWKWPLIAIGYTYGISYLLAFIAYQSLQALGF